MECTYKKFVKIILKKNNIEHAKGVVIKQTKRKPEKEVYMKHGKQDIAVEKDIYLNSKVYKMTCWVMMCI